ncbi:DUF2798 domain-containing protein [Paenibacillus oryzae]|uniref:DUF2798 domain-containing protein n=1 Tax=Paenibacillus oryzae TaxID=1844972 RepID=A0A1A5YPX7_9BACL|nr:DUF2798 domain-containing protein [Paenibacillus oryzae]OBR67618.1 DUF2798 domain-containing protein [Paenibacillus oryzae]
MPATKKESLYFGLMMCFGMVIVMTTYNLALNNRLWEITLAEGVVEFLCGISVAFLLDFFLVGPFAKKMAFKLPINKSKKVYAILSISTCMVIGMAACMSLYGLAMAYWINGPGTEPLLVSYLQTFGKNFIVALPLQLLIVGPLVRYVFIRFVQKKTNSPLAGASQI